MKLEGQVDTRELKSGKMRLRFKLNDEGKDIVEEALSLMGEKYPAVGMEYICLEFLSGVPGNLGVMRKGMNGNNRMLIYFYPDQYQSARLALDKMRKRVDTDADALVAICSDYLSMQNLPFCSESPHAIIPGPKPQ